MQEKQKAAIRLIAEKIAVAVVLVAVWGMGLKVGYSDDGVATDGTCGLVVTHILWMVCHGNVWHLSGNLFVLFLLRRRLLLLPSTVIAFVASWLPVVPGLWDLLPDADATGVVSVTMGFSGVLFAIVGIKWGDVIKRGLETPASFCKKMLPFALLGFFIPHINWSIHTCCLLIGFAYGRWK